MDIEDIVALSVKHNATDLHLCHGQSAWRQNGELHSIADIAKFSAERIEQLARQWLTDQQYSELKQNGQIDFAITLLSGVRLRVHFFIQYHGLSVALRIINTQCPALADLRLPSVTSSLLEQQNGIILVAGATGSGKSTTLSAMVEHINQQRYKHILTLEDPIEFLHTNRKSLIQQREIGSHCCSFSEGLRAALREDPDIILIGELRDSETIRLALTAAETGHLVLATLHTRGAPQTIDRLVDVFSADEKHLIRTQLSGSLKAVLAQHLIIGSQGGRVALFEMLINTPAVANLIRDGKTWQLAGVLQTGSSAGMQTFEQSQRERRSQGLIR